MGIVAKLRTIQRVMAGRTSKGPLEGAELLKHSRPLQVGVNAFELAQLSSGHVDPGIKALAGTKAAARIGCLF